MQLHWTLPILFLPTASSNTSTSLFQETFATIDISNKLHFTSHSNKLSINSTKVSDHLQLFHNIWLLQ